MEPIRYVDLLIERYSAAGFPPYEWSVNDLSLIHISEPTRPY